MTLTKSSDFRQLESDIFSCILPADISVDVKIPLPTSIQLWITDNVDAVRTLIAKYLHAFLQNNWTGPPDRVDKDDAVQNRALIYLGEVESVYALCRCPEDLVLALVLAENLDQLTDAVFQDTVCLLQIYWIQQCLQEEKADSQKRKIVAVLSKTDSVRKIQEVPKRELVQYLTSAAHILSYYSDIPSADAYLKEAMAICDVLPTLTGILGRRTRFQQVDYAQLVVCLEEKERDSGDKVQEPIRLYPPVVTLDDETLLEETHLSEAVPRTPLKDYESTVLLSEGLFLHRRRAWTELLEEETLAYLDVVLKSNPPYTIRASALFFRSKYEATKSKRVVRAMQQLEALVTCFSSADGENRLEFCIASSLPPIWKVQEELGFVLLKNGCAGEAVNIFTALQLWEDVIECYQRMGQMVKAEDLILKELQKQPTPSMWCRLGEIRDDADCYNKAWELSKHRSARSRRQLGMLLVKRKQYAEAVEVIRQGLGVSTIDAGLWFTLGYALIKTEKHAEAEVAFRRCVNLDQEHSLAWNNLGSIALRNKENGKAFRILQDSLKADYENWNVWDNYQNACHQMKEFEEELKAFHRLLEIRGVLNADALGALVATVVDGTLDANDMPASRLLQKLKELFGALTAKLADNYKIWALYAKLQLSELQEKTADEEKRELLVGVIQKYQRAYRYATKEKNWEKDENQLVSALNVARELGKTQLMREELEKGEDEKKLVRSSVRVMLDNVMTKVSNFYVDSGSLPEDAKEVFEEVTEMRTRV